MLIAPLVLEIDTREPQVKIKWSGLGNFLLGYREEWFMRFQFFFFRKTLPLAGIKRKKKIKGTEKKKKRPSFIKIFKKGKRVLRSCTVEQWELALQHDDATQNARLYPLNFVPRFRDHLRVNFTGENYLYLRIRNRAWKMLYAYFRK